jgi:hypothetical protein
LNSAPKVTTILAFSFPKSFSKLNIKTKKLFSKSKRALREELPNLS